MVTVLRWSSDRGGVRKRDGGRSESADCHQLVVAIGGAFLTHGTMPPIWLSAPRNGRASLRHRVQPVDIRLRHLLVGLFLIE